MASGDAMLTSCDRELRTIKERYGCPEKMRFFLLDLEDLNFHHYGVLNNGTAWSEKRFVSATKHLSSLDDCTTVAEDLIAVLAKKCNDQGQGTAQLWEELLRMLCKPKGLAQHLEKASPEEHDNYIRSLGTLLHLIPQSCTIGVVARPFSYLLESEHGEHVRLSDTSPWEDTTSTLGLLRPLEYFFEIGSEGSRDASVHLLRAPTSLFPLGICINFSEMEFGGELRRETERVLEALHIGRLANALASQGDSDLFYEVFSGTVHRAAPMHSAIHWRRDASGLSLAQAIGLPLRARTSETASVLAERSILEIKREVHDFLRDRALSCLATARTNSRETEVSPYGSVSAVMLPSWSFNGKVSGHPMDPTHCVSLSSYDRQHVVQMLVPAAKTTSAEEVARRFTRFLQMVHSRTMIGTSSDRVLRAAIRLPDDEWTYHPSTAFELRSHLTLLRRCWAGDPIKRERVGLLFFGAKGSGKTHLAKWVAREIVGVAEPRVVPIGEVKGELHGSTEKAVEALVRDLCTQQPVVIIVNEIEDLAWGGRTEVFSTHTTAAFKAALDTYKDFLAANPAARTLLIGTTNYPETLEGAIADRFMQIEFVWQAEQIEELSQKLTGGRGWTAGARKAFAELAKAGNYSGRAIATTSSVIENRIREEYEGFPVPRRAVEESDVRMVMRAHARQVTQDGIDFSSVSGTEANEFFELLRELLRRARDERWTDNSKIDAVGLNANEIAFVNRMFPTWGAEFRRIKSGNRGPGKPPPMPLD